MAGADASAGLLRRALDGLYLAAGAAAGLCMVGLLVAVLLSVVSRLLHFNVPGIDAYAGYLMAAAGFLALAHTLQRGEHIRVTLVLERAGPRWRRGLERWSRCAAAALGALWAAYSVRLVWQSHRLNDMSTSSDATPLWIPQMAMALGTAVFAVALADAAVRGLRSDPLADIAAPDEATRHE